MSVTTSTNTLSTHLFAYSLANSELWKEIHHEQGYALSEIYQVTPVGDDHVAVLSYERDIFKYPGELALYRLNRETETLEFADVFHGSFGPENTDMNGQLYYMPDQKQLFLFGMLGLTRFNVDMQSNSLDFLDSKLYESGSSPSYYYRREVLLSPTGEFAVQALEGYNERYGRGGVNLFQWSAGEELFYRTSSATVEGFTSPAESLESNRLALITNPDVVYHVDKTGLNAYEITGAGTDATPLTLDETVLEAVSDNAPKKLAIDPNQRFMYICAVEDNFQLSGMEIQEDGTLSHLFTYGNEPHLITDQLNSMSRVYGVSVSPDSSELYVYGYYTKGYIIELGEPSKILQSIISPEAGDTIKGRIAIFDIDTETGQITFKEMKQTEYSEISAINDVEYIGSGQYLIASSRHSNSLALYRRNNDIGTEDGSSDGNDDGSDDGSSDGDIDGSADGSSDGDIDGSDDGDADGSADGSQDGDTDESADGDTDGSADGSTDGDDEIPEQQTDDETGGGGSLPVSIFAFAAIILLYRKCKFTG